MISLTGCSLLTPTVRVHVDTTCDWFEDQRFSQATKDWLRSLERPEHVEEDLRRVAQNTQLSLQNCLHLN